MGDKSDEDQIEGEWSHNQSSDRKSRETNEWPPQSSEHPVIERVRRWSKNKWEESVRPYAVRIGVEATGMVVLGAILGTAWMGISSEMIVGVFAQSNQPLSQMGAELMAGGMKFIAFVGIAWAGVATTFSQVRDTRRLPQLFVLRPLRTTFYTIGLTVASFFGTALGWVFARVLMRGELLSVAWWQAIVGVLIFAVLYAMVIDGEYRSLYYSS